MSKLGENLQREWDNEPKGVELWDALKLFDTDSDAGIVTLTELADGGSALAMMYLGCKLLNNAVPSQKDESLQWLKAAVENGSVEAGLQLAAYYLSVKQGQLAVEVYEKLAEAGSAPAMYRLGQLYYFWGLVERDVAKSVAYLEKAKAAGHIPAMGSLARIYLNEDFGIKGRVAAHWNCLTKIPAAIWYLTRYPESDRLRGLTLPSDTKGKG